MDTDTAAPIDTAAADDGPYLRRAQELLAARGDLFLAGPGRSVRLAAVSGPPRDRAASKLRHASRQLMLPMPRQPTRRRPRMVR
ncbi:MAG: hypothetical protein WAL84_10885 [Candidatus Dormiibacterota bacterium]